MKKSLGNTSLQLSSLGMGTGDFFWNSSLSEEKKVEIIQTGIEHGITFIDTAEGYGNGSAEITVGHAIEGLREKVVIASKFSPEHHAYDDVLRAAEGSLKRLKTDYIDLYQIHWPNPSVPLKTTMRALKKLFRDGVMKAVGMSNFSLREIKEAQDYLEEVPLSAVQMEYNLFERTIEENHILDHCNENKISLLAYSPLDQGQLSAIHPNRYQVLKDLAEKYDKTVPQIILRWLMSRQQVVPITRTTTITHLLQNAEAMTFDLSEDEIKKIDVTFPIEYAQVPTGKIQVALKGEWDHPVYQTLEQALENKLNFVPSPQDLAVSIQKGDCLKPVRLKRRRDTSDGYEYDLVAGRIRYWAWVIAHRQDMKPIPAYIREEH